MRRRDVVFACVAWGGLLAGLAWALLTQFRWVRENKPIQVQRPLPEAAEPAPVPTSATGVVGTIGDDTRAAMAKGLRKRSPQEPVPPPASRRAGPKQPPVRPD